MTDDQAPDNQQPTPVISAEIYEAFRQAVAIGRWPNGLALSEQQSETCLQAIILYEHTHVAEHLRTGYVPPKATACAPQNDAEQALNWQNSPTKDDP